MFPIFIPPPPRLYAVVLALIMVLGFAVQSFSEHSDPEASVDLVDKAFPDAGGKGNVKKNSSSGKPDKHGAFASPDIVSPEHILSLLPPDLSPEQLEAARLVIQEAIPRLQASSTAFVRAYGELRELSINRDTPPDCLTNLGHELSSSRKALRRELRILSRSLEHITGRNPRLDDPKTHPMVKQMRKN